MKTDLNNETTNMDENTFWQAVLQRDTQFDGVFIYAVRSTGIYCRPGCASRHPRREQVLYFTNSGEAQKAGFRSCKRCRPDETLSPHAQAEIVTLACRLLEENSDANLTLPQLAQRLSISPSHLHRIFKAATGVTPHQYAVAFRLKEFKKQSRSGTSLTDAIYNAGYGSNSRLYETSSTRLGMTPKSYVNGGKGMEIRYTIVDCSLGRMLVAGTERGLCAVSLGSEDISMEEFLHQEYPAAQIHQGGDFLQPWVNRLQDYLAGMNPDLHLPLDLQATAFQLRVWQELRRIPYGETRTYTQVAESIGKPSAVRAVANACAANPAVLVTPCHRVVRSDGSLGGYRWGIERKKALLSAEGSQLEKNR